MPGVASREAETQAFYKGSKLGNRDRRNSLPSNVMGHSSHYDESTREAFSLGYHNGYKRLPRPAR